MTFNPAAAISILEILEHAQLPDRDLVIDFGSQRYTAQRIFPANSTRDFYVSNGFKDYISYDVNDCEYNIKYDLNEVKCDPEQASLVTNIGTSEHIFDQCSVFTNMHNICKVGGVMFFHLPFTPWLNHGFYNYNPILFSAIAYANKYECLFLKAGDREGNITNVPEREMLREKGQVLLEKIMRDQRMPQFICCAFKKKVDASFRKPFQGKYRTDIKDDVIMEKYK